MIDLLDYECVTAHSKNGFFKRLFFLYGLILALSASSCVISISKPCQDGGDPARETSFRGNRTCTQKRDPQGKYVNHGLYQEWHLNGKLALEGYYKMGKKDGRWIEYNPEGRKVSEKLYDYGLQIPEKPQKP